LNRFICLGFVALLTFVGCSSPKKSFIAPKPPVAFGWNVKDSAVVVLPKHWDPGSPPGKPWHKDLGKIWHTRSGADSALSDEMGRHFLTWKMFQLNSDSSQCPITDPGFGQDVLWLETAELNSGLEHFRLRELQFQGKPSQTMLTKRWIEARIPFCLWIETQKVWVTKAHATARVYGDSAWSEIPTAYANSRDVSGPNAMQMTEEIHGDWKAPLERDLPLQQKHWQYLLQQLVLDLKDRTRINLDRSVP
jgi:hypothetical protein